MNLKNLLDERLKPGFALKRNQKYGEKGGRKLNLNVIEQLKSMFLTGNIEKNKKILPRRLVENNELEAENTPSLQQIKYLDLINSTKSRQLKMRHLINKKFSFSHFSFFFSYF